MKGIKKKVDENRRRYVRAEEKIEFIKVEIEKFNDQIKNSKFSISEDDKHRDLLNKFLRKEL